MNTTAAAGLCTMLSLGCAHHVAQDAATGADGTIRGARRITLENNEGRATGIVTYPGGDRVDWKFVQLPADVKGTLDVELTWTPPRPGLDVQFDVFDEWNEPIIESHAKRHKGHRSIRTASLDKGPHNTKYFVRVYAPNRGDAGAYALAVEFRPTQELDWTKVDVPDPPRFPAIPTDEPAGDEASSAPKPDVKPVAQPEPGPPPAPSPVPAPRPPPRPPIDSRVQNLEVQSNWVLVTIPRGRDQGVTTDWTGVLLRGDTGEPLRGGEITIVTIGAKRLQARVHLTPDQINANQNCRLIPPALDSEGGEHAP